MWFCFFYRWMQCRAAFLQSTLSRTRRGTRPAWTTTTRPSCWWTTAVLDAEEERRASGPNWRTTSPTSAQASGVRTLLQVLALVSELTSSVFRFVCQEMQPFMIMHHSGKESKWPPAGQSLIMHAFELLPVIACHYKNSKHGPATCNNKQRLFVSTIVKCQCVSQMFRIILKEKINQISGCKQRLSTVQ